MPDDTDDDGEVTIEQLSGEGLKSDDSDPIGEGDGLEVGGGDSGYADFSHDEDEGEGTDE